MANPIQVSIVTEDEADEILRFWTTIYDSLEILEIMIEMDTGNANVSRIREDVNRAKITAQRECKIIMKLVTRGEPLN